MFQVTNKFCEGFVFFLTLSMKKLSKMELLNCEQRRCILYIVVITSKFEELWSPARQ